MWPAAIACSSAVPRPSGAQSSASCVRRPSCSEPQSQSKRTRKTAGCAAPGSCSMLRKAESSTCTSPQTGQANVYIGDVVEAGPDGVSVGDQRAEVVLLEALPPPEERELDHEI